jgi:transcriptional regulator with XRE-family HTH domain
MGNISTAVRKLRKQMDLTQQDLANRLGVTARAVANYEAGRVPRAEVLSGLCRISSENKLADLAQQFAAGLRGSLRFTIKAEPLNDEEVAIVRVVLCLARDKDKVPEWDQITQSMLSALDALAKRAGAEFTLSEPDDLTASLVLARTFLVPNAELKLYNLARERAMKTGESPEKARNEVLLEYPELYAELIKDRAAAPATVATKKGAKK